MGGKYRTITRPLAQGDTTTVNDFARSIQMDLASIPPYDPGMVSRTWSGTFVVTTAERDNIISWYLAQRGGTRPSLVVPVSTVNDAWVCFLQAPSFSPVSNTHWSVELTINEVPRCRW
jgi:hypothetical protein